MTLYELALTRGLTVQWTIASGAFVVTAQTDGDDASYTGRGLTLDAAVMDALAAMDGAGCQNSEVKE